MKLLVKQSLFISCVNLSCRVPVVGESGWRGAIIICHHWVKENLRLKNPAVPQQSAYCEGEISENFLPEKINWTATVEGVKCALFHTQALDRYG